MRVLISGFASSICEPPVLEFGHKIRWECGGDGPSVRFDGDYDHCAVRFSGNCVPYWGDGGGGGSGGDSGDGDGCSTVMAGGSSRAIFDIRLKSSISTRFTYDTYCKQSTRELLRHPHLGPPTRAPPSPKTSKTLKTPRKSTTPRNAQNT